MLQIIARRRLFLLLLCRKNKSMLVKTYGGAVHGISATTVTVEVNISQGINFYLVGLPDSAVKESHQRIDAALKNNDLKTDSFIKTTVQTNIKYKI
jgi:hypothetical protein